MTMEKGSALAPAIDTAGDLVINEPQWLEHRDSRNIDQSSLWALEVNAIFMLGNTR